MKVLEYRFLSALDESDPEKYPNWSRAYEYPAAISHILSVKGEAESVSIHNSSWGQNGVHVTFREELDKIGEALHSDIRSSYSGSVRHDITEENPDFREKFDCVLNISTIEHLSNKKQIVALTNLFGQVKKGGRLIVTFDFPRVKLESIESWIGERNCGIPPVVLNGNNSTAPNPTYGGLHIVLLVVEKTEDEGEEFL